MGRIKFLAVVMAAVMLMPVLASCSSGAKKSTGIKASDPWYDSTKFELGIDLGPASELGSVALTVSGDKIYFMYYYTDDRWGSTKTVLDTYDLNGNRLDHKRVSVPDGKYFSDIYSVKADPDGKTLHLATLLAKNGNHIPTFADIDADTGEVTATKDMLTGRVKEARTSGGSIFGMECVDEYMIMTMGFGIPVNSYRLFLYKDNEFATELEFTAADIVYFLGGASIDRSTGTIYMTCITHKGIIVMGFDADTGKLVSNNDFAESDGEELNFAEYTPTSNGDLCKIDSFGNIVKINFETMKPETVIDANWYNPYFCPMDTDSHFTSTGLVSCSEDMAVLLESVSTMYCDMRELTLNVIVLKKADKNPNAGKEIIELALPPNVGISEYLAAAIYEFNNSDEEYIIRVWSKYNSGYTIGRSFGHVDEGETKLYEMIQDLKSDEAPDLAIGIQKNYAMRDDVFMDLTDFLDPEVMEKQYGNIIEAGRINGKLYFLPVTVEIEALVANEDIVKDGAAGLTFDEYDQMIEDYMYGYSPYDFPYTDYYNRRTFILSCIDTKSAIEGDQVDFGTEQFRTAVEYARDHFEYDDLESTPEEFKQTWERRNRGECIYTRMDDYLDYVHACLRSNGRYSIIGTPSIDASGPRFKAVETISVSATTDVTEGCRKFLNYLFSGKAYDSKECDFQQIVTNKEIMKRNVDDLTRINNAAFETYQAAKQSGAMMVPLYVELYTGVKASTDDMIDIFLDSMSNISTYYYEDYEITKFVFEEIAPYLAGDRTLDEVIVYLNDRATKYVREM